MDATTSDVHTIGYTGGSDEDFRTDEELIPGSLVYTDSGEAFKVNEDGSAETIQFPERNSEAGLKKPAFSMPSETRMLLDMYENGDNKFVQNSCIKNKNRLFKRFLLHLVEVRRIELLSKNFSISASPSAVASLHSLTKPSSDRLLCLVVPTA